MFTCCVLSAVYKTTIGLDWTTMIDDDYDDDVDENLSCGPLQGAATSLTSLTPDRSQSYVESFTISAVTGFFTYIDC